MKGRGSIALAGAVVALALAAPSALAATIVVNDDAQPADCVGTFTTIQAGITAASRATPCSCALATTQKGSSSSRTT
jgi:hypothetical protein